MSYNPALAPGVALSLKLVAMLHALALAVLSILALGWQGGCGGGPNTPSQSEDATPLPVPPTEDPANDASDVPCGTLHAVMRDFSFEHPDFERDPGGGPGIVESALGADRKPVYAHAGAYLTVTSPESFAQWYNDVEGVNQRFEIPLPLEEQPGGTFVYDDSSFFPLDNMGFGDQCPYPICATHNFHFTTEIHANFVYKGGEIFNFTGDDDVFVFINGRLAIDLGGIHPASSGSIDLDANAAAFGLTLGESYPIDFFHAERRVTQSNFRIETTIECLESPPVS